MKCFVCKTKIDEKKDTYGAVFQRGYAHTKCWYFPTRMVGTIKNEEIKEEE